MPNQIWSANTTIPLKAGLITLAIVIFIAACGQTTPTFNKTNTVSNATITRENLPLKPSEEVDELAAAKDLFAANCMICHKDTGKGGKVTIDGKNIKPFDLTSDKMKARTDDKLIAQIKDGSTDDGMPAFNDKLSDDQIKQIVKYMRKLQQTPASQ